MFFGPVVDFLLSHYFVIFIEVELEEGESLHRLRLLLVGVGVCH